MKPIKIDDSHKQKIETVLSEANGRSVAHAYTGFDEIHEIANRAEIQLSRLLLKKGFPSAEWVETSGERVANSYFGSRNGTQVRLLRKSEGWYLVEAKRVVLGCYGGHRKLYLRKIQDLAARDLVARNYTVLAHSTPEK
ncbi:MAG: hypothetical protein KGK17_11060 [Betaproteobacteria bacterium]|nr:hypothetical protein [Betaproteobacteria bacterium]